MRASSESATSSSERSAQGRRIKYALSKLASAEAKERIITLRGLAVAPIADATVLAACEGLLEDRTMALLSIPYEYGEVRWVAAEAVAAMRGVLGSSEDVVLEDAIAPCSAESLKKLASELRAAGDAAGDELADGRGSVESILERLTQLAAQGRLPRQKLTRAAWQVARAELHEVPGCSWRLEWKDTSFEGWSPKRWNRQVLAALELVRPVLEPLAIELQLADEEEEQLDSSSWTDDLLVVTSLLPEVSMTPSHEHGVLTAVTDLSQATMERRLEVLLHDRLATTVMRLEVSAGAAMLAEAAELFELRTHPDESLGERLLLEVVSSPEAGRPCVIGPLEHHQAHPPLALTIDDTLAVTLSAHWSYWSRGGGRALVTATVAALEQQGWRCVRAPL